jgi:hypothetical protein
MPIFYAHCAVETLPKYLRYSVVKKYANRNVGWYIAFGS